MADVKQYTSKAGTEIHAVFNDVQFGDLYMINYAIQRDVANIHVMGNVDAVGIAKGKRATTGACVFAVFDKDRLIEAMGNKKVYLTNHELINYGGVSEGINISEQARTAASNGGTIRTDGGTVTNAASASASSIFSSFGAQSAPKLLDQIPPFDIVLVGISEASGQSSRMVIHGVQFNSDQGGSSIDDLLLERKVTFIASRITPWTALTELSYGSTSSATGSSVV